VIPSVTLPFLFGRATVQYIVRARASFDAAHQLADEKIYGSRCARIHGHHWTVEVAVRGTMGPRKVPNVERRFLQEQLAVVCREYDGRDLNRMMPVSPPSPENVALQMMERLQFSFVGLWSVTVWEDNATSVTVEKEQVP